MKRFPGFRQGKLEIIGIPADGLQLQGQHAACGNALQKLGMDPLSPDIDDRVAATHPFNHLRLYLGPLLYSIKEGARRGLSRKGYGDCRLYSHSSSPRDPAPARLFTGS